MAQIGIATALLLLAAFGGMQFFITPACAIAVLLAAWLLLGAWLRGADLRGGLVLFAMYWPAVWAGLSHFNPNGYGNRNIIGVWFVVAALVLLTSNHRLAWLGALLNVAALLYIGSRGAIIGLWAGLLVQMWRWPAARRWLWAAILAAPLLLWWRPHTAIYRLWYWQQGLAAWWSAPWLGLGFGGLQAACWIPEPGGGCQIHAHNLAVYTLAEFGLVGLLGLLLGLGLLLAHSQRPRWSWALLVALLAHAVVDVPMFWPGPLALFVVLLIYPWQFLPVWKKIPGVTLKKLVVSSYSRR